MAAINPIVLQVIKEYVKRDLYIFKYSLTNKEDDKTYLYIKKKGISEKIIAKQVISGLVETECIESGRDNNKNFDNGTVFVFITRQLGDKLYVKVKIPDTNGKMLIMSIHPEGMYRRNNYD